MRLVIHPKVSSDISTIMEYYERVSTQELADEFYRELRHFIVSAGEQPESFSIRERDSSHEPSPIPVSFSLPYCE